MIKKAELVKELQKCLLVEDRAIPIYSKHIESTLFLSKLPEVDKERMRKALTVLRDDSMRHQKAFQALIDKVRGSDKDVY